MAKRQVVQAAGAAPSSDKLLQRLRASSHGEINREESSHEDTKDRKDNNGRAGSVTGKMRLSPATEFDAAEYDVPADHDTDIGNHWAFTLLIIYPYSILDLPRAGEQGRGGEGEAQWTI